MRLYDINKIASATPLVVDGFETSLFKVKDEFIIKQVKPQERQVLCVIEEDGASQGRYAVTPFFEFGKSTQFPGKVGTNVSFVSWELLDGCFASDDLEKNYSTEDIISGFCLLVDKLFRMRDLNIVHGDISPGNIVFAKDLPLNPKFIDFEGSRLLKSKPHEARCSTNLTYASVPITLSHFGEINNCVHTFQDDAESLLLSMLQMMEPDDLIWVDLCDSIGDDKLTDTMLHNIANKKLDCFMEHNELYSNLNSQEGFKDAIYNWLSD